MPEKAKVRWFEVTLLVGVPEWMLLDDFDNDIDFVEEFQYRQGIPEGVLVDWVSANRLTKKREVTKDDVKTNPWAGQGRQVPYTGSKRKGI